MTKNMKAPWTRLGRPLKMGLQSCGEADWLMAPDPFGDDDMSSRQMDLKKTLHQTDHAKIFDAAADSIEAGQECFDLIQNNLAAYHGIDLTQDQVGQDRNLHPIDSAARQIPEDILLLCPEPLGEDTIWVLKAASLAFPSHWVLAEKMHKPMSAIHAPVPDYDKILERPVDRFFNAMLPETISLRRNWTLQIDDGLFTPSRHDDLPLATDEIGRRLHVRVERQTLRKMPKSGWIIFTIQTHLAPLNLWRDDRPSLDDLINQIDALSDGTRDYRGVDVYYQQLCDWILQSSL